MEYAATTATRPVIQELEPRILYSADLAPALDLPQSAPVEQRVINESGEFVGLHADASSSASREQAQTHELVFIDASVEDSQRLIADIESAQGAGRKIEAIVVERGADGLALMSDVLAQSHDVSAVHIVGHGRDGEVELGSTRLDFDTLLHNAGRIRTWGQALTPDADVLLYGCDVAQTARGRALVDALARLTGADVAASDDLTGSQARGGDWDLEYRTGPIEAVLALSTDQQFNFDAVLDASAPPAGTATSSANNVPAASAEAAVQSPQLAAASLPLAFERNVGQADAQFDFLAHGSGYAVALSGGDAVLALDNDQATQIVRLEVTGKNAAATANGESELQSKTNYLIGSQDQWHTDVANFGAVDYANIYDGVDLRYYGTGRQLEYDFVVKPGADAGAIRLQFEGVQQVSIAANGDLTLSLDTAGHTISFKAPIAYQDDASGRVAVDSHYVIHDDGSVGFDLGAYDATRALVIDPTLSYGTYIGGSGADVANGLDVDAAGNLYVTGYTKSAGVFGGLLGLGGLNDAFVTKLSPTLNSVIYSTYIGGAADDFGTAIAVDASGAAYVTGYTRSAVFPTLSAYQATLNGTQDAFVSKLNANGNGLIYSTYLGGSGGSDVGWAIAVDSAGSAYVTGVASQADFPKTVGAADTTYAGSEAFVTKFSPTGNTLAYSSFIGGSGSETGYGIAVDSSGNAVVVGQTSSSDFPTTANGYRTVFGSGTAAFVTRLNNAGTAFTYSTYLGQSNTSTAFNVALDSAGKIYVTGQTGSSSFDVTPGALQTTRGGNTDAFVSVLNPNASGAASLVYSTYLGGSKNQEAGLGIGVDTAGRIYVGGQTDSDDLPVTPDAAYLTRQGSNDGFVVLIDPQGSGIGDLVYGSYFGGANADNVDNAMYRNGRFYIVGDTASSAGIATAGSSDTTYGGGTDAFAAVFTFNVPPTIAPTPTTLSYVENAGAVPLDAGLTVSDPDSALLLGATVQISANYIAGEDVLAFNNINTWGITGTWNAVSATLTLTGSSSVANYQAALRSITYQNTVDQPSTALRTVTFKATDGILNSSPVSRQIAVNAVNDAPTNAVPGPQTVNEDQQLLFSTLNGNPISINDIDAGSGAIQVSLNAINGTLTLAQTTGLTFITGTGSGNATMTFTGTLASINSALDGLIFAPAADFYGAAALQIVSNDQGNSGGGGPLTTTSMVAITVNPVNDAPVNIFPGPQATAQNTALVFSSVNGNAIGITDVDAGSGILAVTLTATNGALTLGTQAGLATVAGDGSALVSFSGTLASLNNALNGLEFVPAFNYGGPAGMQISVSDQGNSGAGGPASDSDFVAITVSPNVPPALITSGGALTYTEQAPATPVDSGITVADGDSPVLSYAIVRIAANYSTGDVLAFTNQFGITGSWDAASGTLTLTGAASAASYQAALRSVTYQNGIDNPSTLTRTVSFVANDGIADSPIATRTIVVSAINDAPIITVPTPQSVDEDATLTFSAVGGNQITVADVDAGGGAVQLTLTSTNGTLLLAQVSGLTFVSGTNGASALSVKGSVSDLNAALNGLSFTPTANFSGATGIAVSVNDLGNSGAGGPLASSASIGVTVLPVNDAPTGTDHTVSTLEDVSYTFAVSDFGFSDANDAPANNFIAVNVATLPTLGTLTNNGAGVSAGQSVSLADIAAGHLRYTPAKDANGPGAGSFTFQVQDDGGIANGGVDLDPTPNTMTIDVTAVNDAPACSDNTVTGLEDTAYTFATADFGFSDPLDSPANNLNAVIISSVPVAGTLTLSGVAVSAGQTISAASIAAGNLQFMPASDAAGPGYTSFTFQVQDDGGTANGGLDLDQTPNTLTIDVTAVNDAPAGTDNTITMLEDGSYTFAAADFGFTDPKDSVANNLVAVSITTLPSAGSLTLLGVAVTAGQTISVANINAGDLVFAPAADANGTNYANFTFQVQDDGGIANGGADVDLTPNTMSIDVTAVNDPPAGSDNTITAFEDAPYTFAAADFGFSDTIDSPANSLAAVLITTLPAAGNLTLSGVAVIAGQSVSAASIAAGNLKFTPAPNATGVGYASFSFQVQDSGGTANGGSDLDATPNTITIDVTGVNDAPTGANNTVTTLEDTPYAFTAADFGFSDPSDVPANNLLSVKISTLPAAGSLMLSGAAVAPGQSIALASIAAGNLQFVPAANANGAGYASFTFQVRDDGGTANGGLDTDPVAKTMTIDVTAVDDAPVIVQNTLTLTQGATVTFSSTQLSASDVDNPSAGLLFTVSGVTHGQFQLSTAPSIPVLSFTQAQITSGQVQFVHDASSSMPSYDVTVSDGTLTAGPAAANITFSISPPTTPVVPVVPVAVSLWLSAPPPIEMPAVQPTTVPQLTPTSVPEATSADAKSADAPPSASSGDESIAPTGGSAASETASRSGGSGGSGASNGLRGSGNGEGPSKSRGYGSSQSRATAQISALNAAPELETMLMLERPELELTAAQAVAKGQWSIASAYSEDPTAVQKDQISVLLDTAELGGVALSVGVVWWASRLTGVIGSFLASMPAWRELDPLPVLGRDEDEEQRWQAEGEDPEAYADEVAISMFLDGAAPSSAAAA